MVVIDGGMWKVQLFGAVRGQRQQNVIDRFQTAKTAELFSLLAIKPGSWFRREQLIDMLWPDADLNSGRNRLNQALAWLRKYIECESGDRGRIILADRTRISFSPEFVVSDVQHFNSALKSKSGHLDQNAGLKNLVKAAVIYTAEFAPGYYDECIVEERSRLAERMIHALSAIASIYYQRGQFEAAISFAKRAVKSDPLREESYELLINCLIAAGHHDAALREYHSLVDALKREFSASPSSRISQLVDQPVWEQRPSAQVHRVSPVPLPRPSTRFFGRSKEIDYATEILGRGSRLLSILGIGGSGKTRLAIETAGRLMDQFNGNVFFVPLADIPSVDGVLPAIAETLRLQRSAQASVLDQIVDNLYGTRCVVVLDNAEHLLPELAPVIKELLAALPVLSLLITSQRKVGFAGERELHLSPLSVPFEHEKNGEQVAAESVQLFIDRMRLVRPLFELTVDNIEIVSALCRRLDGIPLAIELCAAWAHSLSPQQMLEKLLNRFELLICDNSDVVQRHRSLRAVIEYSFDQLNPELRRFFAMMSVFRGGWNLDAVNRLRLQIDGLSSIQALDVLADLRERSLIEVDDVGGEMRYRMLDTIRDYGREQLSVAESDAVHFVHASYFAEMAVVANKMLQGPAQQEWTKKLDLESQNIGAAIRWCLDTGNIEIGIKLASQLSGYWKMKGHLAEALDWLDSLLEVGQSMSDNEKTKIGLPSLADALTAFGFIEWSMGNFSKATSPHRRALAIREELNDKSGISESLYHLGITAYRQDLFGEAEELLTRSLETSEATNNRKGVARALLNLGNIALTNQNHLEARSFYERSLVIERQLGDIRRIADTSSNIGLTYGIANEFLAANKYFEQSVVIRRQLNDDYGLASDLFCNGKTSYYLNDKPAFIALIGEGMHVAFRTQNKYILTQFFLMVSMYFTNEREYLKGLYFLCAYSELRIDMGVTVDSPTAIEYHELSEYLHAIVGKERLQIFEQHLRPLSMRTLADECAVLLSFDGNQVEFPPFSLVTVPEVRAADRANFMRCPHCNCANLVRFGRTTNGKQRFRCVECRRVVNEGHEKQTMAEDRKEEILRAYKRDSLSLRETARLYHVSRNTLTGWIEQDRSTAN
jgi:predicted ATPase/DNA-binding SARP family transcriptional activator/transposase-like protein